MQKFIATLHKRFTYTFVTFNYVMTSVWRGAVAALPAGPRPLCAPVLTKRHQTTEYNRELNYFPFIV